MGPGKIRNTSGMTLHLGRTVIYRCRYRIHLRTVSRWRHLAMYIAPVTVCSLFFNIPMFINLQVQLIYRYYTRVGQKSFSQVPCCPA